MNPRKALQDLCNAINIPFDQNMLYWKAGARKEDGIWAKYWYKNVHESTCFQPYIKKDQQIPEHLQPLLEACEPIYKQLLEKAIG